MTKRARRRVWLAALWGAAFGFGCSDSGSSSQVLTGRIDTTGVVAIRAVSGDDVVTAAQVGSDGSFRIALPAGAKYRLEVLTSSGVRQLLAPQSGTWKALEVKVCVPTDPFDMGGVGSAGEMCDPTDPNCEKPCGDEPPPPPPCMDPSDPNCMPPPPPSCGGTNEPPCPECMDPMDPNCKPPEPPPPPPCGGPNEPPCPDEPCMDPSDPNCKPPPPCTDPMDPNCMGCWPGDPSCGGGGGDTDCEDPMDPTTCKDPCVIDPMQCGCTSEDPNCWPPPEPPMCMEGGTCDPGDGMAPTNVPDSFGCMELIGT